MFYIILFVVGDFWHDLNLSSIHKCVLIDFSLISDNKKIVSEEEGDPLFRMLDDPILDRKYPNKMVKKVKLKTHCGDDGCQSAMKLSGYVPPKLVVGKKLAKRIQNGNLPQIRQWSQLLRIDVL